MTLQEALVAYQTYARAEGKSPKTVTWIVSSAGYFAEFLGPEQPDIAAITADDLRRFIIALRDRRKFAHHPYNKPQAAKLSVQSIETYCRAIKALFGFLKREGFIKNNVLAKVKKLVIINGMGVGKKIALWIRLMSLSALCRSLGVAAATSLKAVSRAVNAVYAPFRFMNPLPIAMVLLGASMTIFRHEAAVLVPQLAALMIPTLLVWGAKDKIVPVSNAYAAAKLVPGCQVYIFEDGGHSVYRQKVKEFAQLMTGFLR
jgi:pimeloyl-ACP methyl ester carboxylesterase